MKFSAAVLSLFIAGLLAVAVSSPLSAERENVAGHLSPISEEELQYYDYVHQLDLLKAQVQSSRPAYGYEREFASSSQFRLAHQDSRLARMQLEQIQAYQPRGAIVDSPGNAGIHASYESFLLKPGKCETISTWCCKTSYFWCTCGSAKTCAMTFKNIHSYNYTVPNGKFIDLSGNYFLTPVTLCNVGKKGDIFVSSY